MQADKRRNRLLYFRISEEEFEQILKACQETGARSVSDLARNAVREFMNGEDRQQILSAVKALGESLSHIREDVQLLTTLLREHEALPERSQQMLRHEAAEDQGI